MQWGCLPVVSDSYSLPEVVGDNGLIIKDFSNFEIISESVRKLLNTYTNSKARNCIEHINENFDLNKRKEEILKTIKEVSNEDE